MLHGLCRGSKEQPSHSTGRKQEEEERQKSTNEFWGRREEKTLKASSFLFRGRPGPRTERRKAGLEMEKGVSEPFQHSAIRDAAQWVGLDMGNLQIGMMLGGFPGGSVVKNLPAMPETQVPSLGGEDPLEEGVAIHSSMLAWRIPLTEETGRL